MAIKPTIGRSPCCGLLCSQQSTYRHTEYAPGRGKGQKVATAFFGYVALALVNRSCTSDSSRSGAKSTEMRAL